MYIFTGKEAARAWGILNETFQSWRAICNYCNIGDIFESTCISKDNEKEEKIHSLIQESHVAELDVDWNGKAPEISIVCRFYFIEV